MKTVLLLLLFFLLFNYNKALCQTISSHKDGISYTIISNRFVNKPTSVYCGFSDLGNMLIGRFKIELREYFEYKDNMVIRSWKKEIEIFIECLPNQ